MNKKNLLNSGLLIGSVSALMMTAPLSASAQDSTVAPATQPPAVSANTSTNLGVSAVDAGKLIGKDVIGSNGKTVGEIDSVIVDTSGKVSQVVLDVGGWLESDKKISVNWKDLKSDADGNIHTNMTKESAEAAAGYKYKDDSFRGKVLNETGQLFASNDAAEPATATTASNDTNASMSLSSEALNADGSFNASKVVGMTVKNNANEDIGEISEVLLNKSGKVDGVVVDVGGFLGIGAHPVKLGWNQIKLQNQDGSFNAVVNIDKNALKQMPAYDESRG